MLKGCDEPTHFLTIYLDADNLDFLMKMQNKKNVDVWMGLTQGLAVMRRLHTKHQLGENYEEERSWHDDRRILEVETNTFVLTVPISLRCNEELLEESCL